MRRKGLKLPSRVRLAIRTLTANIRRKYSDAEVYLFRSYARGDWIYGSDLDVIIISKAFHGQDWIERIRELRMLAPEDKGFEILAYTPKEFQVKARSSVILRDASRYWLRLSQVRSENHRER